MHVHRCMRVVKRCQYRLILAPFLYIDIFSVKFFVKFSVKTLSYDNSVSAIGLTKKCRNTKEYEGIPKRPIPIKPNKSVGLQPNERTATAQNSALLNLRWKE